MSEWDCRGFDVERGLTDELSRIQEGKDLECSPRAGNTGGSGDECSPLENGVDIALLLRAAGFGLLPS